MTVAISIADCEPIYFAFPPIFLSPIFLSKSGIPMFLSRFRVRGYKCLEDIDLALTPIHVLIGPGDSGKTGLLEAISAFYGR